MSLPEDMSRHVTTLLRAVLESMQCRVQVAACEIRSATPLLVTRPECLSLTTFVATTISLYISDKQTSEQTLRSNMLNSGAPEFQNAPPAHPVDSVVSFKKTIIKLKHTAGLHCVICLLIIAACYFEVCGFRRHAF